jgi:hypothetical protein
MGQTQGVGKIPIDELRGVCGTNYTISWTSPEGIPDSANFPVYYNTAYEQKYYGYVHDKKDIHIWYDKKRCNIEDLITLIAHEKGHTIEPFYKDQSKEEKKAQKYADVALEAYREALKLIDNG